MPKRLTDRLRNDSIQEFRAAAKQRYKDGELLASAGNGLAAVYVWGYAAEMALKASYFDSILFDPRRRIERIDLRSVVARGAALGISWSPHNNLHDISSWAETLVAERRYRGTPFQSRTAFRLVRTSHRLYRLWRETLRYRSNRAYSYEVEQVRHYVRLIMNLCEIM